MLNTLSHKPDNCDTGEILLEWDVSNSNKTMKVETKKALYVPGWFMKNSTESLDGGTNRLLLLRATIYLTVCRCFPMHASFSCQRPDRLFSLITKSQYEDEEQDERKISLQLWFPFLWKMTKTKENNNYLWDKKDE